MPDHQKCRQPAKIFVCKQNMSAENRWPRFKERHVLKLNVYTRCFCLKVQSAHLRCEKRVVMLLLDLLPTESIIRPARSHWISIGKAFGQSRSIAWSCRSSLVLQAHTHPLCFDTHPQYCHSISNTTFGQDISLMPCSRAN